MASGATPGRRPTRAAGASPRRSPASASARRHGGGDGGQHAGDVRGALRRADGRRRAERAQHPARRRRPSPSSSTTARAKVLITDREFAGRDRRGAGGGRPPSWSSTSTTPRARAAGRALGRRWTTRRSWPTGDPDFAWQPPDDEWQAISLNYTSGTTGNPKGVVYHHRGAYLIALGNALHLADAAAPGLPLDAADVPLQRLVLPLDRSPRSPAPASACAGSTGEAIFAGHRRARRHPPVRRADRPATWC